MTFRLRKSTSRLAVATGLLALAMACGKKAAEPPPPVTWEGPGTGTVGAGGGTVALTGGPHLAIPAGALAADTAIAVTAATPLLAGALTPVFQFEPDGTTFAAPATVSFTVPAGTTSALLLWSARGSPDDFEKIPLRIAGTSASAEVTHFSMGVVTATSGSSPPTAKCPPRTSNPCEVGRWDESGWIYAAHCVYDSFASDGTACWPLADSVLCGEGLPCNAPPKPTHGPGNGAWLGSARTPWDGHCVSGSCKAPPYRRISGTVHGDQPQGGATVMLDGDARSGTAALYGSFGFSNLVNGYYSLTPKAHGYTFTPPVRTVSIFNRDVDGQDFVGRADVHRVSGTVSGAVAAGVSVTLAGATTFATATDAAGHYAFEAVPDGTYTATPHLAGYLFDPQGRSVSMSGADVAGVDFTARLAGHSLSGTVAGAVQAGVTVALAGSASATATTDALGQYAFAGLLDGSYTVTPGLAGYDFAPASRTTAVSGLDVSGQDFTASAVAGTHLTWGFVAGEVLADVTVTVETMPSGTPAYTAVTGTDGAWSFRLPDGHYLASASLAGYAFDPQGIGFTLSGGDFGGFVFTGRHLPRWQPVPSGTQANLYAVAGRGPGDAWAVGVGGTTLHWDGTTWSAVPSGTLETLRAAWCAPPGATDGCWAAGDHGTLLRWDDQASPPAWSGTASARMDLVLSLTGLWGSGSPEEVWAVGDQHTTRRRGADRLWAAVPNPLGDPRSGLHSVWGSGPGDVWAVGGDDPSGSQSRILRWDGAAWAEVAHPNQTMLRAVWGSGPGDLWTAGGLGHGPLHWDGSTWTETSECGGFFADGLWGSGPADAWLVGFDDLARQGGICRWDGSTWTQLDVGASPTLHGVWGSGPADVWAVGEGGTILRWVP